MARAGKKAKRVASTARRLLRFISIVVLCVLMLPFVLLPLYRYVNPVSTFMIADFVRGRDVQREWIALNDVAPAVARSVLMSEDGRFCTHHGVDWRQLRGVVEKALAGERTRGASTLTMQLVKNLFLWADRSYLRKGLEVPLALYADLVLPKDRIMEIYLNIAEWGDGIYGIEAGAMKAFGRSASAVNRQQAALLAVVLPNPRGRNASRPSRRVSALAAIVRGRADASGAYIKCL